jgi:hypothetical protein
MENNTFNNFEEYLKIVKEVIKNNCKENNEIGRSLRKISFLEAEVDANFQYFRECYNNDESPEYVISNLKYNEDELYRKIDNITDSCILDEVNTRNLTNDVISQADTYDLEEEIDDRWDKTLYKLRDIDVEDAIEIIKQKNGYYNDYTSPKAIISEALGLSNSYSYTVDEIIEKIKKIW